MFCPRCSRQQVSDDIRFCTGCGFQLDAVIELLLTDGAGPSVAVGSQAFPSLKSRKGTRIGIKLIFFSIVILPLILALSYTFDSPVPFWVPAVLFLTGASSLLYWAILGEDMWPVKTLSALFDKFADDRALPSPTSVPIGHLDKKRVETAEMIQPRSVTESTTRLLKKSEN